MKVEDLIIRDGVPVNSPNLIFVSARLIYLGGFWPGRFDYWPVKVIPWFSGYLYAKGAPLGYALSFWFWLENSFWNSIYWLLDHDLIHFTTDEYMEIELKNFRFGKR